MGTPGPDDPKAVLLSNNRYAGWCTIAVFAGLVVEYTILLFPKWKDLRGWEKLFTVIAGIAIVGGVWGEYHFGSKASHAAVELEEISNRRIAEINREAQTAKLETALLEAAVGGRRLTQDQETKISVSMRRFAGLAIFISSYTGDAEAARLGLQIKSTLEVAGIHCDNNLGRTIAERGGVAFGVDISGPPSDANFIYGIAKSLRDEAKIDAEGHIIEPKTRIGSALTGIMIGLKPLSEKNSSSRNSNWPTSAAPR